MTPAREADMLRVIKECREEQKWGQTGYFQRGTVEERNGFMKKANIRCGIGKKYLLNICFKFYQWQCIMQSRDVVLELKNSYVYHAFN